MPGTGPACTFGARRKVPKNGTFLFAYQPELVCARRLGRSLSPRSRGRWSRRRRYARLHVVRVDDSLGNVGRFGRI
jgi:hypothetical protein